MQTIPGRVSTTPLAPALPGATGRRVLLAWEYGRNLGHLSRLSTIAKLVEVHGGKPMWAVPTAFMQAPQLSGLTHPRRAAPKLRPSHHPPSQRIDSFADIMLSFGFADAKVLGTAVRAWQQLFDEVQADIVVLDYAPAAQLAAQLSELPAFQITNGFDAPPPECPIFGISARGPYLERLNTQKIDQINTTLIQVGHDVIGRPGPSLQAYFSHPFKAYDCIAPTDPYGLRDNGFYMGPLTTLPSVEAAVWPEQIAVPKIFAYLRDIPNMVEWLEALGAAQASTLCVWPDASNDLIAKHSNSRLRIVRTPVDITQALTQADAVLNYGSTTTVTQTLLAGKPQLMVPRDIEKTMVARRVVQHGAGLMWSPHCGTCAEALNQLLNNRTLGQAALSIAAQFPVERLRHKQELFIQALLGK